ncbi:hypothetical protein IID23_02270 [Patescibacteria group bacterium]|nr:hypothetical protein [Patescibacteria group bacterium]
MTSIIPLTSNASSIFEIEIEDRLLTLQTKFNGRAGTWTLNIDEGDIPLAIGITLVLGVDIIRQLNLEIGALLCFDTSEQGVDAEIDTLGSQVLLMHLTEEEIAALEIETVQGATIA